MNGEGGCGGGERGVTNGDKEGGSRAHVTEKKQKSNYTHTLHGRDGFLKDGICRYLQKPAYSGGTYPYLHIAQLERKTFSKEAS